MTRGPLYISQLGLLYYTDTRQFTSKLDADKGYRCVGTIDLDDDEYAKNIFKDAITNSSAEEMLDRLCADERTKEDVKDFMNSEDHGLFIWLLVPEDK